MKQADGNEVSPQEQIESIYCLAYLSGFTDSVRLSSHFDKPKAQKICLPETGASNEQLARVVTKWLREHPDTLHQAARIEIMIAFEKAFPCR